MKLQGFSIFVVHYKTRNMETIVIECKKLDGKIDRICIYKEAIECPYCGTQILPQYLYTYQQDENKYDVFCQCTNPKCKATFISDFVKGDDYTPYFKKTHPNPPYKKKTFSKLINQISPSFKDIYNQAYQAKQMRLSHICGMGFRKALEFLIKDYLIYSNIYNEEEIKSKMLGKCIENYVEDDKIKEIAKRAVWIGNDETHYVRKWENKDIKDLINLIGLTILWIEAVELHKETLESMPDNH